MFTDTFTGISPISFPYFIVGQIGGCLLGNYLFNVFDED